MTDYTNDNELAEAVVGLGVGTCRHWVGDHYLVAGESYTLQGDAPVRLEHYFIGHELIGGADMFVRDPRVAMAMLQKMSCLQISAQCKQSDGQSYHGWLKRPRAIVEAAVKALGGDECIAR